MGYLDVLLASTRERIDQLKQTASQEVLEQRMASVEMPRGFAAALTGDATAIIGEIKRASPAKGPLDVDLNAASTALAYARGGVAAISVLTEPTHFRGTMEDLSLAREADLPVLRKDFILDDLQVLESRASGADAVLIIVRILDDEVARLIQATTALGMDALVEVHDERDLERAVEAGATLIGINHRDLDTFEVDPDRTARLAPLAPSSATVVALSGVSTRADVVALASAGADAVLVGEILVRAPDPAAKLRELLGPP